MKPILEVIVPGNPPPSDADDPRWSHALRVIPGGGAGIAEIATSAAARHLAEGAGEFVALAAGAETVWLRKVGMLATLFGTESCTDSSAYVLNSPAEMKWDLDPLDCFGRGMRGVSVIVFRRKPFRQVGPLRAVSDPIWDWLIRARRAGLKFNAFPSSELDPAGVDRLPLLAPPPPDHRLGWLREHLADFTLTQLAGRPARSPVDETALRAGLFQWHDFLDESHQLSQSIEGRGENQLGDYWHAIMHRREPDYSNAKYWFRQIGPHAIFRELRQKADAVLEKCAAREASKWRERLQANSRWDPFAFVDLCQACAGDEETDLAIAARRVQQAEMGLLMAMTISQCAL